MECAVIAAIRKRRVISFVLLKWNERGLMLNPGAVLFGNYSSVSWVFSFIERSALNHDYPWIRADWIR